MRPHLDRRVLFVTHNGLTEPLGRRQVLPYVVGLSARGWKLEVLSFEKSQTATPDAVAAVRNLATEAGILWRPLRYHRRPALLATAFDALRGSLAIGHAAARFTLVHARSTVPAAMARLGLAGRRPWLFDVRGLLGEEYADAGHWPRQAWRRRATSAAEERLLAAADAVVVLTERLASQLGRPCTIVPCCVDTELFQPCEESRRAVRRSLGWDREPVIAYSGSLGSWYRLREMLDFYQLATEEIPALRLLLLTPEAALAASEAERRGCASRVRALAVAPDEVPRYLAAADAGICFLGRHASKRASSPTKFGEYLASGLPVITNPWIGDAERLGGEPAWLLVGDFSAAQYRAGAVRLAALLEQPERAREAARQLAVREFALETGIDRYDAVYRQLTAGLGRSR